MSWPIDAFFFDLDDTLFDTSGKLVPRAHLEAAEAMVRAGLRASVAEAVAVRRSLAARSTPVDVDHETLRHFACSDLAIAEAGRTAFYDRAVGPIALDPNVRGMLERLAVAYHLALVTFGGTGTQLEKVQQLGLQPLFHDIVYVDRHSGHTKRDAFERLLERHQLDPARVVVVGDRLDSEIEAGNVLGMLTVQVRWGEHRHREGRGLHQVARLTIDHVGCLEASLDRYFYPPD